MTWPGGAEVASQVGVGGGARAGSAAGPAACAGTRRPEMAAPGLRLCAAAALLLLLPRLPLRARADEHEHTVRRVPASPGSGRAAAPASPPAGPAAVEGRRRPQRPGQRGPVGGRGGTERSGEGRAAALAAGRRLPPRGAPFSPTALLGLLWPRGPSSYGIASCCLSRCERGAAALGEGLPEFLIRLGHLWVSC